MSESVTSPSLPPLPHPRPPSALSSHQTAAVAFSLVSRLPLQPLHPVNPSSTEGILVKLKANQVMALSCSKPFRGSPLPQKQIRLLPESDRVLLVLDSAHPSSSSCMVPYLHSLSFSHLASLCSQHAPCSGPLHVWPTSRLLLQVLTQPSPLPDM